MAILTISLDSPALSKSITISGANLTRILQRAIAERAMSIIQTAAVPAVLNPDGSVLTPAVPAVMRNPTNAEIFNLITVDWLQTLAAKAVTQDQSVASKTASDAVTPITIT